MGTTPLPVVQRRRPGEPILVSPTFHGSKRGSRCRPLRSSAPHAFPGALSSTRGGNFPSALFLWLFLLGGCATAPVATTPNPMALSNVEFERLWTTTVQVLDEYFDIAREDRITGRIETYPQVAATLLEPWRRDSVDHRERLEATLQTLRRRAVAVIQPAGEGSYTVSLEVYKELEDLPVPVHSPTGEALFRTEPTLHREHAIVTGEPVSERWINRGRDWKLEARILEDLRRRLGASLTLPQPSTTSRSPLAPGPFCPSYPDLYRSAAHGRLSHVVS
jgi:hypothetical protein